MGIANLLPYVKKATRKGYINEFRGKTIAIDVSVLLHGGMIFSSRTGELVSGCHVRYVNKYVQLFRALNCHVVLVFDGRRLPAKREINEERHARREENQRRGEKLLAEGRAKQAHYHFQLSASITRDVIESTIQAFQDTPHVDVIVAPYEADAQLAYLVREKLVDAVCTIDSDLVVFGCDTVLYKVRDTGECDIYERHRLHQCLPPAIAKHPEHFTLFRRMCILVGCDYLPGGLCGVGMKKAEMFFSKMVQVNSSRVVTSTDAEELRQLLPRIPAALGISMSVGQEFVDDFIRAESTFLYQTVFDPRTRQQVPLNPFPQSDQVSEVLKQVCEVIIDEAAESVPCMGKILHQQEAVRLALGNAEAAAVTTVTNHLDNGECSDTDYSGDLFTLPDTVPNWSIWSESYHTLRTQRAKENLNSSVRRVSDIECHPGSKRSAEEAEVVESGKESSGGPSAAVVKRRRSERVLVQLNGRVESSEGWSADEVLKLYASDIYHTEGVKVEEPEEGDRNQTGSSEAGTKKNRRSSRYFSKSELPESICSVKAAALRGSEEDGMAV